MPLIWRFPKMLSFFASFSKPILRANHLLTFISMPTIKNLECSCRKETIFAETPQTLCPQCKGLRYVRYDLRHLHVTGSRDAIARDAARSPWAGMWPLPVRSA